jgi:signal transduction histidine kinase
MHGAKVDAVTPWVKPRWALLAGLGMALLVAASGAAFMWVDHGQVIARETDDAELYARVLEDHANRTLDTAEVAMRALAESVGDSGYDASAALFLRSAVQSLAFVRSASVLDAEGRVRLSSNPANVGVVLPLRRLGVQDGQLQRPVGDPQRGRDLSELVEPPAANPRWLIPYTRVLLDGEGRPSRYLVFTLNPDFFSNAYDLTVGDADRRSAALIDYDGVLIAASSGIERAPGSSHAATPLFNAQSRDRQSGEFQGQGIDGREALVAFRAARRAPWWVVVERPMRVVQAAMTKTRRWVALGASIAWLAIGLATWLAWRSLRARALAQEQAHQQMQFAQQILALSPTPLFVTDVRDRLQAGNAAWWALCRLHSASELGKPMAEVAPELSLTQAPSQDEPISTRLQVQGQAPRDVLVTRTPYLDALRQPAGHIGSVVDVTVIREAERRMADARDAAERANATKTEFVANISHELRTPLQTIIGFAELGAHREDLAPTRQRELFARIHRAGSHMHQLVNNLLDLSRSDLVASRLSMKHCDLRQVAGDVLDELRHLAESRRLGLRWLPSDEPCMAWADATSLGQVVRNLVANAVRFAPPGSQIDVACQALPQGGVELTVEDAGPGIPEAELELIFEPFVQSSATKDGSGGTGLGLAICRKLVAAHGGSIRASNRVPQGARFTVCLPPPPSPSPTAV